MEKSLKLLKITTASAVAIAVAAPAAGIIRRHDVDDQAYIDLAKAYPQPIVLMIAPQGASNGMGTWIADDWLITAAHVGREIRAGDALPNGGPTVAQVVVHPEWARGPRYDVALIRVSERQADAAVVPLCRAGDDPGEVVTFIGAGDFGDGQTGPTGFDDDMRAAQNVITDAGPQTLTFVFDAPDSADALELEGISGPGDSGGPAYMQHGDGVCVAGISSSQDSGPSGGKPGRYGVIEHYARVSAVADWIDAALAAD